MLSFDFPAGAHKCGVYLPSGTTHKRVSIQWSWRECLGYLCAKVILPDGKVIDSFDEKLGNYRGYVNFSYGGRNWQAQVFREMNDEDGLIVRVCILGR